MATVTDKRDYVPTQSLDNQQRYLDRRRQEVHDRLVNVVLDTIGVQGFEGLSATGDISVYVPSTLPEILVGDPSTGKRKHVSSGNSFCRKGAKIRKKNEQELGGPAHDLVTLNDEQYLEILFNNCELPFFLKKSRKEITEFSLESYGYSKYGCPSRLSLMKSYKESILRRVALRASLESALETSIDDEERTILEDRLRHLPLFEERDLRYHYRTIRPKPSKSGVMIMALDSSGSVGPPERRSAKMFFYLVYRFLLTKYDKIRIIPILHSSEASVTTISEFFGTNLNGATEFIPLYTLVKEILTTEVNVNEENVYYIHLSDSDIMVQEGETSMRIFNESIKPHVNLAIYGHLGDPRFMKQWFTDAVKQAGMSPVILDTPDDVVPEFLRIFKQIGKKQ